MIESNVLILLGNGYNRALGLRTSYADFGSHFFTHVDCEDSALNNFLVNSFTKDPRNWCDMEGEIKKFALTYNLSEISFEVEMRYFDRLIRDVGLYMDGEAKYQFLCNKIQKRPDVQETLPMFMFQVILNRQDYHYKVLSFNYTDMNPILEELGSVLHPLETDFESLDSDAKRDYLYKIHSIVDVEYLHLSGKKCILGIDDDSRIHPDFNFLKKAYQFGETSHYPQGVEQYKTIIAYGLSLGDTDSDFCRILFEGVLERNRKDNPRFLFITKNEEGKIGILNNLVRRLNVNLSTIQRHLDYEFILVDNQMKSDMRSSLLYALTC